MYTGPSWAGTQASLIRLKFLAYTWIHISVSMSILICLLKVGGVLWFRLGVPWLVHRLVPVFWHTPSSSVVKQTLAMLMVRKNNAPLLSVTDWEVTYFHGQTDIKLILTSLLHLLLSDHHHTVLLSDNSILFSFCLTKLSQCSSTKHTILFNFNLHPHTAQPAWLIIFISYRP